MKSDTDDDYQSTEEAMQEALEVSFASGDTHRRRSSLVTNKFGRPAAYRQATSCFVHALLEQQRQGGKFESSDDGAAQGKPSDKEPETPSHNGHHTESRLLTKKQLSDMAFGIRELSKKLGHIRLHLQVKNVFLLTKAYDETLIGKTRDLACWLLDNKNSAGTAYSVWVEHTLKDDATFDAKGLIEKDESRRDRLRYWTDELCRQKPHTFDIALALGGDGTVLYASSLFQRIVPPILSFALGSLGFLTKFDYDNHPNILTRAFNEGITLSLRLRFEGTIMRSVKREGREQKSRSLVEELVGSESEDSHTHRPDHSFNILNEIVIDRGPNATMSSVEVFGDEEHFTTVQADGICVATPTGSTAYNLAAGGSLCHPDNPVILLTAICAHTLNFRPIILPDTIVLRVGIPYDARASGWASFDGRQRTELNPGDYVTVSASRFPFPSVLPLDRRSEDWIDSISRTLNWNSRQRQKAFSEAKKEDTV
ncbi:ATP-NAD kinase [Myriangium duriaei CBS 260.36]|uniref:ATP-NAD kinase n=1 Tax=Myriangium duriaei CBS 260.36 TaxID=1168546 RepID=A0A9P4IQJ2_9PEZI|nr:ATP-NAD kinase [Myriangium duriaei CBS 260.36]